MAELIIANDYRTGALTEITIEGDYIAGLRRVADGSDGAYPWVSPGFIDVHINGFGGFDLNTVDVTKENVFRMAEALLDVGVTSFMPTIITANFERMARSVSAIREACEADPVVARSIVGIHLEGPYMSGEMGFRGAHPPEQMRDPDWAEFSEWQRLSGGRVRKVTLAPERDGAVAFVRQLVSSGVIAAMGHSNASSTEIEAAVEAGLSMCTHLGNGIHYLLNRHAPCMWDLLSDDRLYAGFIADGHHLPRAVVDVIVRVKGDKAILVSDAVHLAGMKPGQYVTHVGGGVELLENGRLQMIENPNVLAGSAMSMLDGVRFLLDMYPRELRRVVDMATVNPVGLLGEGGSDRGILEIGRLADLILLDYDRTLGRLQLREVWRQGSKVREWKASSEG